MSLILVGTNYRFSPVELREWIITNQKRDEYWLEFFKQQFNDIEIVILSTCNRFEIYIWRMDRTNPDVKNVLALLAEQSDFSLEQFQQNFYYHRNTQAIKHLFRVTCSMDSMLIGEHQITGQVRNAYQLAQAKQTTGTYLSRLFQTALKLAKRMRNEADISTGHFSLGSVAVEFIDKTFGTIRNKKILVIGAGKMGTGTLTNLIANGAKSITLINRDITRARELAKSLPIVKTSKWENLQENLAQADVVISCIATDKPILTQSQINKLANARNNRPLMIIDIGLPRNIDPQIGKFAWIHLYDLNALENVLSEQNKKRRDTLAKYEYLIDEHIDEYMHWLNQQTVTPVISALREKLQSLAENELAWLDGKLSEDINPRDRRMIEQMTHRLIQKILHTPISAIREQTKHQRGNVYAGIVKKLFKLDNEHQQIAKPSVNSRQK